MADYYMAGTVYPHIPMSDGTIAVLETVFQIAAPPEWDSDREVSPTEVEEFWKELEELGLDKDDVEEARELGSLSLQPSTTDTPGEYSFSFEDHLHDIDFDVLKWLAKKAGVPALYLEWATTCSKLRTGSHGGGAAVLRFAGEDEFLDTGSWLDAKAEGLHEEPREMLLEFLQAIESTGGVTRYPDGTPAPVADPEWTDLGDLYVRACNALGREVKEVTE